MEGISDADLDGIRLTVNSFLPNTATNSRTAVTCRCRVDDDNRDQRIEGLPTEIRLHRWLLVMPDGQDVKAGDLLTVPGKGVYTAWVVLNPTDDSTDTRVVCVLLSNLFTGATVTFRDPALNANNKVTAGVNLYEASRDAVLTPYAAEYQWAVVFPSSLTYPNNHHVLIDHMIQWSELTSTNHEATLKRPRKLYMPVPLTVAYFNEMGASSLM